MNDFLAHLSIWVKPYHHLIVGTTFAFMALLGIVIAPDYGLSWDEGLSHQNGIITLRYIQDNDPEFWTYSERYYGTIFELPFAWLQGALDIDSMRQLFIFRHAATFLFFLGGVFFFYWICLVGLRSRWLAFIGAVFLLASPRIFADAFYNSKDIPSLIFAVVSVYTLIRFLDKPAYAGAVWHALATALLIAIRLPGLFIPAMTLGFVAATLVLLPEERRRWRVWAARSLAYILLTIVLTVLFWPFLWRDPLGHFAEAYVDMSRFPRQAGMELVYLGNDIIASEVPWHYVPVWIGVTTPPLYLALATVGMATLVSRARAGFAAFYRERRTDLVVLAWLVGPILSVIVLGSVLYDGWRHLYFVYPALIYFALHGLAVAVVAIRTLEPDVRRVFMGALSGAVGLSLLLTISFMWRNHPYQNVYFNFLAGGLEGARDDFDLDYWGLSFRQGLEYILANDSDEQIPIAFAGGSPDTLLILPPEHRERFVVMGLRNQNQAEYILTNYRWQDYDQMPWEKEVYSVRVDGTRILSVFKMR